MHNISELREMVAYINQDNTNIEHLFDNPYIKKDGYSAPVGFSIMQDGYSAPVGFNITISYKNPRTEQLKLKWISLYGKDVEKFEIQSMLVAVEHEIAELMLKTNFHIDTELETNRLYLKEFERIIKLSTGALVGYADHKFILFTKLHTPERILKIDRRLEYVIEECVWEDNLEFYELFKKDSILKQQFIETLTTTYDYYPPEQKVIALKMYCDLSELNCSQQVQTLISSFNLNMLQIDEILKQKTTLHTQVELPEITF